MNTDVFGNFYGSADLNFTFHIRLENILSLFLKDMPGVHIYLLLRKGLFLPPEMVLFPFPALITFLFRESPGIDE